MDVLKPVLWICLFGLMAVSKASADDCPFGHMKCATITKCVPLSWKCDGDADCSDGSDEIGCPAKTCADTEFSCEVNGTCIPQRWLCDGEPDCDNGNDESAETCSEKKTCLADQFMCDDGECISNKWKCDGVEDCKDGNDEKNCSKTCDSGMFTCADGQCISQSWYCDGDADCLDKSDEKSCSEKQCDTEEFRCSDSTRCIDQKWKCDGDFDCADHSDETNCTETNTEDTEVCSASEFKCTSGECIHMSWHCDNDPDCIDASDEGAGCPPIECQEHEFQCANEHCIADILRCDHTKDCIDGSDEEGCNVTTTCADRDEFDCYGDGTLCISRDRVCDGINDCMHREDEDPDTVCEKSRDPCLNHQCEPHSHCVKKIIAHDHIEAECRCNAGFKDVNGICEDIDECQDSGMCSQLCENTKGGYKCSCLEGYTLEKHHFCRAEGDEAAWLYYTNRRDIRRLRTDISFMDIVIDETENSVGIDMDIHRGLLFWTDSRALTITRAKIDKLTGLGSDHVVVKKHDVTDEFSSDGIAVDWMFQKIYWTENSQNKVMVANYDGTNERTLVSTDIDDPRAIVVDPENGYVYWTDWGKAAKIERIGMNGEGRQVLAEGEKLGWPNGLAIDYVSKKLFWIDAKLHKIGSMNFDGKDMRYVFEDATEIQQPFAIAVFEDSLYWTDWTTNSIKSVNKFTGLSPKTLNLGSYSIMDIKVYHNLRQNRTNAQEIMDMCSQKQCEGMCVPTPRSAGQLLKLTCMCPDGKALKSDGRSCKESAVPVTPKPATEAPAAGTTRKPVTSRPPSMAPTPKPQPPATTDGGYVIHGSSTPKDGSTSSHEGTGKKEEQSVGGIAAITAAIVAVIIIAVFVVGCLVVRKYRMKNKKSMNFDNPVYRKTTTSDEQCMIANEPQMEALVHHEDV